MRILHLLLIGILLSLTAATATKASKKDEKPSAINAATATAKDNSTLKATAKKTDPIESKLSARANKALKLTAKPGENREKRTLYDFGNAGYLYPQIAARRAGYTPLDARSVYSTQEGYYSGQNALAQFPTSYSSNYAHYPQYLEAPEPIIEIIIKDANETEPSIHAQPTVLKTKKKKEKVHVFYVNYKKDENNKLHLESPIASLNNDDTDEEEEEEIIHYPATPSPPVKSTTLRTIIHPDSEKYHSNSGIQVTFGSEDKSRSNAHILEEHNAESVQQQVVAVPVPHTTAYKNQYSDVRTDFQGQARSPFSSSFFQSSAPWAVQQQQLPQAHAGTYFRAPLSQNYYQNTAKSQQQQQQQKQISTTAATQYYQKQSAHTNQYQQQQQQQHKPTYNTNYQQIAQQQTQSQPQQQQRKPVHQIQQQQPQQQQQSQYYANSQQQYYQQPQQQQQQHTVQHQQYYNALSHKPTQAPKNPIIFPTAPTKVQELPLRQAPQPYQPIKFRPTPAPAPMLPKPTTIATKLENTQYNTNSNSNKFYQFQRQPQYVQQPKFTVPSPSVPSYVSQAQSQPPQSQAYQSNNVASNSIYYSQNQQHQQQQNSYHHAPQPTSNTVSASLSWLNIKPSKETELLKSIPKFEQHITETIQHNYSPQQYQVHNQVIHDIPAPNLGPTSEAQKQQQQSQHQQQQQSSVQGHYITASNLQASQQQTQQQFTNFVTSSSNQVTSTQTPQFGEATDGQKIMIVTPMPPNVYQQYQESHHYQQQGSQNQPAHTAQIINSVQPTQEQVSSYQQQSYPQPRQGGGQASTLAQSSQFGVSTYHTDVFRELEQRTNKDQSANSQQTYAAPAQEATTSKPFSTTTVTSTTTVDSKNLHQLPAEVPDDLRQQLLSSGILNNADISILDYDKVGDIALENLPAEHLQHFYGAGGQAQISASKKVLTVVKPNGDKVSLDEKAIERVKESNSLPHKQQSNDKVIRFDGQQTELAENLNSSAERQYNRYLPLKINAAQFPKPDAEELKGKYLQSVVVLAPVDTPQGEEPVALEDTKEVKFLGGDLIKTLVKKPTRENFKRWLEKESRTDVEQQSVVLLVAKSPEAASEQEIFMYDIATAEVNKLNGELSSRFVIVAEENASSEDLEHGSTLDPNFLDAMMLKSTR